MLSSAPVAFRCTRISFERASRVSGTKAPDFAIFVLLSSKTKYPVSPCASAAFACDRQTMCGKVSDTPNGVALHFHVWAKHLPYERLESTELHDVELIISYNTTSQSPASISRRGDHALFTAKFPSAALAARCTSVSWLLRRNRMGSSVSRVTGRTSFSVISAKASAALRWRSTLSENESVVSAARAGPSKKLVVVRSGTCGGYKGVDERG